MAPHGQFGRESGLFQKCARLVAAVFRGDDIDIGVIGVVQAAAVEHRAGKDLLAGQRRLQTGQQMGRGKQRALGQGNLLGDIAGEGRFAALAGINPRCPLKVLFKSLIALVGHAEAVVATVFRFPAGEAPIRAHRRFLAVDHVKHDAAFGDPALAGVGEFIDHETARRRRPNAFAALIKGNLVGRPVAGQFRLRRPRPRRLGPRHDGRGQPREQHHRRPGGKCPAAERRQVPATGRPLNRHDGVSSQEQFRNAETRLQGALCPWPGGHSARQFMPAKSAGIAGLDGFLPSHFPLSI